MNLIFGIIIGFILSAIIDILLKDICNIGELFVAILHDIYWFLEWLLSPLLNLRLTIWLFSIGINAWNCKVSNIYKMDDDDFEKFLKFIHNEKDKENWRMIRNNHKKHIN